MSPRSLHAILFDWDGTLLDSAAACLRSYERLFRFLGIPFDRESFDGTYSPDWYRTYEKVGLPRERWDEADAAWLEMYADEECELVPGAREALAGLSDDGLASGLVTSGSRDRVERELDRLGLDRAFGSVVCSEDVRRRKPDPEALYLGLERLGIRADEAAYVGDSPEDVAMARAAGVFSVGVAGSFPNVAALRAAGANLYADDVRAAVDALRNGIR